MPEKIDQYAPFAQDFSQTRNRPWPEFEIFSNLIKFGDRVADVGCGNGRLRQYLDEKKVRIGDYFGLDFSRELLKIAQENHPKDHWFHGDFSQKWVWGAKNFDWVISIAAFHHLLKPSEQTAFFREAHRVLKPGGKIFITTWVLPQKYFWLNFWRGRVFSCNWLIPFGQEKHPRIYRRVPTRRLQKLAKSHGFRILKAEKFQNRNYVLLAEKI